jgi:hypothetical protein
MRTLICIIVTASAFLPLAAAPQQKPDSFTDALHDAAKEYQGGDIEKARTALYKATAILDARQAGKVADSFPDAPKDWTSGEVEREVVPDLLGGGKTIRKAYMEKGSRKKIILEVIIGSKLTGLIAGMSSNDAVAASQGYTVKKISADRAMLKGNELLMPVDEKVLIKLTASGGADDKELMTMAHEVDRFALKRMK